MLKSKGFFLFVRSFLCVLGCLSFVFNLTAASAQARRANKVGVSVAAGGGAPVIASTLVDSFVDADSNGRADADSEITYTATIANNGTTDATNVSFNHAIDANFSLVANSVQTQGDLSNYALRCTFTTAGAGTGDCNVQSNAYSQTDTSNVSILGGQDNYIHLQSSNPIYNAGTGVFSFDATVQNLLNESLGTLDGTTLQSTGVRLFLDKVFVWSGSGNVTAANADGTGTFTKANQSYFQYSEILDLNETSASKNLQLNVPNTVNGFTLYFLISTKTQPKLVINEVLANPGGTITDANGEWFEVYNAGTLPVNMKGYLINDFAAGGSSECEIGPSGFTYCARPSHTIASDLVVPSGGYRVLGNTTNTTNNGGVTVDYAYGNFLQLANSLDGVRIRTTDGTIIDKTFYASAGTSAQNGISRELKNQMLDNWNMDGSNFLDALVTAVYGPGGRGTPRAQNSTFTPFAGIPAKTPEPAKLTATGSADLADTVSVNLGTITPGGTATVTYRVLVPSSIPSGVTQIGSQGTVSGDNFANVLTDDPATGAANDATVTPVGFAPTAASVTIAGRVTDGFGRSVPNAPVVMIETGSSRTARTNQFGFYRFADVPSGSTVVVSVSHKLYVFAPQIVSVTDNIADLNFTAENLF